jgi:hypothetical protein
LSLDADTAMLALDALWPTVRAVMGPRWEERVCSGARLVSGENERRAGSDQTWT